MPRDRTHAQHRTVIPANGIEIIELTGSIKQKDNKCAETKRHAEYQESNERRKQKMTRFKTIILQAHVIYTTSGDMTLEFPLSTQ